MSFAYTAALYYEYENEQGKSGDRIKIGIFNHIQDRLKVALVTIQNAEPYSEEKRHALIDYAVCMEWFRREQVSVNLQGEILPASLTSLTVVYHPLDAHGKTRIYIRNGTLYTDDKHTKLFDTSRMVTHLSGPGKAIFVVDPEKRCLHADSHVIGHNHHSSLLAAKHVGCAGEIEVSNGIIKWLSNKSGHYRPTQAHLLQTLHWLHKYEHIQMDFSLKVYLPSGEFEEYSSPEMYQRKLINEQKPDYQLHKLLAHAKYLTDDILGQNNWCWKQPGDQQPGVYIRNSTVMVEHKVVRKWLRENEYRYEKIVHNSGWDDRVATEWKPNQEGLMSIPKKNDPTTSGVNKAKETEYSEVPKKVEYSDFP